MPRRSNFSKRTKPSFGENALGLQGRVTTQVQDFFSNPSARTGYGSPNLGEGGQYPLVRFTFNYWDLISLYEGSWIARKIVDVPAADMVRAWPKLTSDVDPKQLTKIDRALRRTNSKGNLLTALKWGKLFGGAGCLIAIKGQEKELDQPLDLDAIEIGGFKGLIPFDRWSGIYPNTGACTDIDRPLDFNKPESYTVRASGGNSFEVHASRILRFTGPEVPTPEREAYSWWGISVLEPTIQEIQKRDNVSYNILNLTFRACILGMKFPQLAQLLAGLGSGAKASMDFARRMEAVNHLISNQSLVPLPADGSIEATSYSFGGLGEIYTQFQLDVSGAAGIPVTRMWGRTMNGLGGTSNEGDEKVYEERIATDQDTDLRPQLEKLYPVLCASELGEVPDDLDLNFPSIRVLDEKEKSELAKTTVDTVVVCLNSGLMSPRLAAKEIKQSSDKTDLGTNLTDEFIDMLSDKVQAEGELGEGLFGGEGSGEGSGGTEEEGEPVLTPTSGPQKVLREEGRAKKAEAGTARAADSDAPGPERVIHGLRVVIETPKGFPRHGRDEKGRPWQTVMPADYGYIRGAAGADGDALDCYVAPDPAPGAWAYIVDQSVLGNRKKFDESKILLGFPSQSVALKTYDAGHHRAKDILLDWTGMPMDEFAHWLVERDPKKPCSPEVKYV